MISRLSGNSSGRNRVHAKVQVLPRLLLLLHDTLVKPPPPSRDKPKVWPCHRQKQANEGDYHAAAEPRSLGATSVIGVRIGPVGKSGKGWKQQQQTTNDTDNSLLAFCHPFQLFPIPNTPSSAVNSDFDL